MSLEKYRANIAELEEAVASDAFVRNVRYHRLPDGTLDTDGNLRLWKEAMKPFEKTFLWENGAPGFDPEKDPRQDPPYLVFIPAEGNERKDTILIAHGGGFTWRTGCEAAGPALAFHRLGYNTAILSYRLAPAYSRFDSLADMQRALRLLRSHEQDWNLGNKYAVMGFSAGGMMCGNMATHFDGGNAEAQDAAERFSDRPDAAVVCYGAMTGVSFPGPFMSRPSGNDMFGDTMQERLWLAPEKNIRPDTPPMFIWQTMSDDGRHGMCLAKALQDAGIPYELHIFTPGVHGLGLADGHNDLAMNLPHVAHWAELCDEWLKYLGI